MLFAKFRHRCHYAKHYTLQDNAHSNNNLAGIPLRPLRVRPTMHHSKVQGLCAHKCLKRFRIRLTLNVWVELNRQAVPWSGSADDSRFHMYCVRTSGFGSPDSASSNGHETDTLLSIHFCGRASQESTWHRSDRRIAHAHSASSCRVHLTTE